MQAIKKIALKVIEWLAITAAILVLLLAVLFTIARIFLPHVSRYHSEIQTWATNAIHQPIRIGKINASWRGFEPEIRLENVSVLNQEGTETLLNIQKLEIGIDVFNSLINRQLEPGLVILSGLDLTIQQDQTGKITVNGISASADETGANSHMRQTAEWILTQSRISVRNVNVHWFGKDNKEYNIKNIRFHLINRILLHHLAGSATLAEAAATRIHFAADLHGDLTDKETIKAELYVNLQNVILNDWLKKEYLGLRLTQGKADTEIWSNWDDGKLQSIQSKVNAKNILLKSTLSQPQIPIESLSGNLFWNQEENGWALSGDHIQLVYDAEHQWPALQFSYQLTKPTTKQAGNRKLTTSYINVVDVKEWLLATNLLEQKNRDLLNKLNPKGELSKLTFTQTLSKTNATTDEVKPAVHSNKHKTIAVQAKTTSTMSSAAMPQFNLTTDFQHLSWQRYQKIPGAINVSGSLTMQPNSGTATLNVDDAQFDFGNLFVQAIPIDTLTGKVTWQKTPNSWQIHANEVVVENSDANAHGNLQLTLPNDSAIGPEIDLLAGFAVAHPKKAPNYLPVGIMPKGLIKWLDKAIVSGDSASGNVILRGPLNKFPFDHQEGRFIVDSDIHDITLNYYASWPHLEHLNGKLIFDNSSMIANVTGGQVLDTHLTDGQATINNLRQPVLEVKGNAKGDISEGLNFIRKSPLNATLGKQLSPLDVKGPMQLGLQLTIPFDDAKGDMHVLGDVTWHEGTLRLQQWNDLTINKIAGAFQFTENAVSADKIKGELFDHPIDISLSLEQPKNQTPYTQVVINGIQASIEQIQNQFQLPEIPHVSGTTAYQVTLQLPKASDQPNTLLATSNLQGITVDLPAPLQKAAEQTVPFNLQMNFGSNCPLQFNIQYGNQVSTSLTYQTADEKIKFTSGEILLGPGKAQAQSQPGLLIDGKLEAFSWEEWSSYLPEKPAGEEKSETNFKSLLRKIDVMFAKFDGFGMHLQNTRLQLEPKPQAWLVTIDNASWQGQVTVPENYPKGTLQANMQRCVIASGPSTSKLSFTPNQIPALNVTCNTLRYGDKTIGKVELVTTSNGHHLEINRLNVSSSSFTITSSGDWQAGAGNRTTLQGKLSTDSLGDMLKQWNLSNNLVGGKGGANFNFNWPKAPYELGVASLNGDISLRFTNGRIINLSKSTEAELGLGRVLNLFSLQSLPRLGDFTSQGFGFDIMQGDFKLINGNANTTNAYLNGPIAKVEIKGRIGLAQQDYDVTMRVNAYVTSSLPLVATVAGGPIVGAVAWVANKVLSPAVSQLTSYQFKITGSWQQPNLVNLPTPTMRNKPPAQQQQQQPQTSR